MEINHDKQREFLDAVYRNVTEANRLLAADPNFLHYRSITGETTFHYLIVESEIELAATLLEKGADINNQNEFGATPLMDAVMLNCLDVVKWLVEHGANLSLKNVNGETALALATSNDRAAVFQFLVSQPLTQPISFYFDNLTAHTVVNDDDLIMKDFLIQRGLTDPYSDP